MSDEKIEDKITNLKCEIFDIIRQQEILNNQMNQLQNLKIQKGQELQILESLTHVN